MSEKLSIIEQAKLGMSLGFDASQDLVPDLKNKINETKIKWSIKLKKVTERLKKILF